MFARQVGTLRIFAVNERTVRLVWHLDVDDPDTGFAADLVNAMFEEMTQGS